MRNYEQHGLPITPLERNSALQRYLFRWEVAFITENLSAVPGSARLLDACCGQGDLAISIRNGVASLIGLDIDGSALGVFRERCDRATLAQGDVHSLPFAADRFDCVMALHAFDHLDRIRFLAECYRVLRPNGILIFDFLNRRSYKLAVKHLRHRHVMRSSPGFVGKYVHVFSWSEVLQALARIGFEVRAVSGYGWVPFTVDSRSILVNAAARLEQVLQLDRIPSVSPRVLVAAGKQVARS